MTTQSIGISTFVLAAFLPALGAHPAVAQPAPPAPSAPHAAAAWHGEIWAQEKATGPVQTERIVRTFKAGPGAALVLNNIAGDIKISGTSGTEIRVEALKSAKAADEASAKALLEATRIEMTESGSRVEVRTIPKDKNQWNKHSKTWVDYTVSLPATAAADVRAVSGDIEISSVTGAVDLTTVSGDISAANLGSRVTLKSVSGDVTLSTSQPDAELRAKSVSGDVMVKDFKARSLEVGSVSGDVRLLGGLCERASAESVSGDLELAAAIVKGGRYELKTHSGSVTLVLDGKVGFELEANSFSGRIRSDLDLNVSGKSDEQMNKSLRGTYGDGAAWIRLASFSGNVVVTKK